MNSRIAPTPNITDDLTWVKGKHTIQAGLNWHQAKNITIVLQQRAQLQLQQEHAARAGQRHHRRLSPLTSSKTIPGAALASTSNMTNAFGAIFGMLNNGGARPTTTALTGKSSRSALPSPATSFRIRRRNTFRTPGRSNPTSPSLAGLRYSIYGVPYESQRRSGAVPQIPSTNYFAQRVAAGLYRHPELRPAGCQHYLWSRRTGQ